MERSERDIRQAILTAAAKLGYEELRPKQSQALRSFVSGCDVFVCLPTGSGKSLCYCLLPVVFDCLKGRTCESIVVVVSPLIALMKDQVRAMSERNVKAVYAGEVDEDSQTEDDVMAGRYQLVFMSPETLLGSERWRDMLVSPVYHQNVVGLVVDEAHCVKKW